MAKQVFSWLVAGCALVLVFHFFPDTPLTEVEGYHAMQVAAQEAHTAQAHLSALTLTPTPTPFSPLPQTCDTPQRGEHRTVTAVEGDGGLSMTRRCYPNCTIEEIGGVDGYNFVLSFNRLKSAPDIDGDGWADPTINLGDEWKCPGLGSEFEEW